MGNSIKNKRRIAEYSEPRGLYPQCPWDKRVVRKEVIAGKMAPCFPGVETGTLELEECPICLLFYPGGLNRMTCCKQSMCTECFLQVKPPPMTTSRAKCPFCKSDRFDAIFTGPLSQEQRRIAERDQQRVLEAQIKMQSEERKRDAERAKQKALKKDTLETEEPKKESKSTTSPSPRSVSSPPTQTRTSTSSISSSEIPETEVENGHVGVVSDHSVPLSDYYDGDDIEQLMLEEALRQSLLESKFGSLQPPSSSPSTNSLSVSLSSTSQPSTASSLSTEAKWHQNHGSTSSTSLSTTSSSILSPEAELFSIQSAPAPIVSEELGDNEEDDDDEETRQAIALSLASAPASS